MRAPLKNIRLSLAVAIVAFIAAGCSMTGMKGSGRDMASAATLTGAQEVPATSTGASGKSTIKIAADKSVSGMVTVDGMKATAAHIHQGAKGVNGPVIVPLAKTSDTAFTVPDNARLTDAQYDSYKKGGLYVNVHSAAYPGGEIRVQLAGQ